MSGGFVRSSASVNGLAFFNDSLISFFAAAVRIFAPYFTPWPSCSATKLRQQYCDETNGSEYLPIGRSRWFDPIISSRKVGVRNELAEVIETFAAFVLGMS